MDELRAYIKRAKAQGLTRAEIESNLYKLGWNQKQIRFEIFREFKNPYFNYTFVNKYGKYLIASTTCILICFLLYGFFIGKLQYKNISIETLLIRSLQKFSDSNSTTHIAYSENATSTEGFSFLKQNTTVITLDFNNKKSEIQANLREEGDVSVVKFEKIDVMDNKILSLLNNNWFTLPDFFKKEIAFINTTTKYSEFSDVAFAKIEWSGFSPVFVYTLTPKGINRTELFENQGATVKFNLFRFSITSKVQVFKAPSVKGIGSILFENQSVADELFNDDLKRLNDVHAIGYELEKFYNKNKKYPPSEKGQPVGLSNFTWPEAPTLTRSCSEFYNTYWYTSTEESVYTLNFCLEKGIGKVLAGPNQLGPKGIASLTCSLFDPHCQLYPWEDQVGRFLKVLQKPENLPGILTVNQTRL